MATRAAAQSHAAPRRRRLIRQHLACLRHERGHEARRPVRSRIGGARLEGVLPDALRVGVADRLGQPLAPQDEQKAVLRYRLHHDLGVRQLDGA